MTIKGKALAGRKDTYLERSPFASDRGEEIGIDPRKIPISDLRDLEHPESYPKAIRAKCLDCACGQPSEVRKCVIYHCPLWPLRMGVNPFHRRALEDRHAPEVDASSGLTSKCDVDDRNRSND